MEKNLQAPDRIRYPKKTSMVIKKTSLMIDELELRREEEKEFQLTPYEQNQYIQLQDIFKTPRPAEKIESAIEDEIRLKEARKEYIQSSKEQHDVEMKKRMTDRDYLGGLLLATGTPVILIGVMLMEKFQIAGIGIIAAGAVMYLPAFFHQITEKRKIRKELKRKTAKVEEVSEEMDRRGRNVDKVCNMYGLPINCYERLNYMKQLLDAAKEYERLWQKKTDYELLVQLNGSDRISRTIADNLMTLSGIKTSDENDYKELIQKLEDQLKI